MTIKDEIAGGLIYTVGDGKKAIFWLDVWSGTCPLMVTFPKLFDISNQRSWVVARVLRNGSINLSFREISES
jgi:hypothetical protein